MEKHEEPLLNQWDNLNNAIDTMVCALPSQMTAASEKLEIERLKFRAAINEWGLSLARAAR